MLIFIVIIEILLAEKVRKGRILQPRRNFHQNQSKYNQFNRYNFYVIVYMADTIYAKSAFK